AATIRCGETFTRHLNASGSDLVSFDAHADEVVSITAVGVGGFDPPPANLRWAVSGPNGVTVLTSTGDKDCAGQCETKPLPPTGSFTLRVSSFDRAHAGDYHLTLEAVSATANGLYNGPPSPACQRTVAGMPDGTRPLPRDAGTVGTIQVIGETDTFT